MHYFYSVTPVKKRGNAFHWNEKNATDFIYIVEGLKITVKLLGLNYTCPIGTESDDSLIFSENISFSFQMIGHLHIYIMEKTFPYHISKVKIQMRAFQFTWERNFRTFMLCMAPFYNWLINCYPVAWSFVAACIDQGSHTYDWEMVVFMVLIVPWDNISRALPNVSYYMIKSVWCLECFSGLLKISQLGKCYFVLSNSKVSVLHAVNNIGRNFYIFLPRVPFGRKV